MPWGRKLINDNANKLQHLFKSLHYAIIKPKVLRMGNIRSIFINKQLFEIFPIHHYSII